MSNPFKKHLPALGVEGKVSGADRKKIRRSLEKFNLLTTEDLETLLPAKAGDLVSVKLAAPRREVIYKLDGEPILIDLSNKGDIMPTVFGLWRAPKMLPRVYVKHPAVTQYLVGGADLMLPGVHLPPEGLPAFNKGDLISVCVHGNPAPCAVGTACMSSGDALARKAGKLVEVLQAYGDQLWEVVGNRMVPNDGFLANAVVPVGTGRTGLDVKGYQEDESGQPINVAVDEEGTETFNSNNNGTASMPASSSADGVQSGSGAGSAAAAAVEGGVASLSLNDLQSTAGSSGVPQSMDELLEMTLLQALHKSVKDSMLPMTSSVLWSQHMQPCRPAGSVLDVKKSSHKKLGAFLKVYGGRDELLSLKEDKHSGDQVINAVDRNCELYSTYRPYKKALTAFGADSADGAGSSPVPGVASGSTDLQIQELWKAGKELKPILEAVGKQHDALYTAQELGEVAFAYVAHADLTQGAPDQRSIVLDNILCNALFKGIIKKGEIFPSILAKSDLRDCFMRRCSAQCVVSRGDKYIVKKGTPPSIQVSIERRQGNKKVTRIVGVESFLVQPEVVATECQRKFATSSTVNELPGKGQGFEVIVQGSVADEIPAFLQDKFAIPKKFINVK